MTHASSPSRDSRTCAHCSASERVLVEGLRSVLAVSYVPLTGLVAVLDTTTSAWVLSLDSASSADDHCWALLDVLKILSSGVEAAESARSVPTRSEPEPS
ncbi:MAG: hypothetical protein QOE59_261 [Actinomycetota bacterium]|jgi:hypothetical protein|nr:hypothetical protein [Actinomycetota bacterium]